MSWYDYKCIRCGVFEVQHSIKDPPLQECPKCKKDGVQSPPPKRLISLSSFHLKGESWAKNGYK